MLATFFGPRRPKTPPKPPQMPKTHPLRTPYAPQKFPKAPQDVWRSIFRRSLMHFCLNCQPKQPKLEGPAVIAAGVGNPPAPALQGCQGVFRTEGQKLAKFGLRLAHAYPPRLPISPRFGAYPVGFFGLRRPKMAILPNFVAFFLASVFRCFFDRLQDAPRCLQDVPKTPQEPPKSAQEPPKTPQDP